MTTVGRDPVNASAAEPLAVVTGASGGVGAALCAELARRGLQVLALGRDPQRLAGCCARDPSRIRGLTADLTVSTERARVAAEIGRFGRVRYLVHAAAVIEPLVRAEALREADWRAAQTINVEAPLFLSLSLAAQLEGGRILHVSSGAAHRPVAGCLAYCVGKAALHMVYRVLQLELAQRRICVGSASPGSVDTPMQEALRSASSEDFPDGGRFRELAAHGQLVPPERSARFLSWLLLDSTDALFGERDWNIADAELQGHWESAS
jgi:NAD(P)-dependent dehydrogenase (short-subunit alcohol dehydrogenase family)